MAKKRCEINECDTWDLTTLFKNDDDFINTFNNFKDKINIIKDFKGHILDSSDSLYNYIKTNEDICRTLRKLGLYASLKHDEDTSNSCYIDFCGKVSNLERDYNIISSFATNEILDGDYSVVLEYINENDKLVDYKFNLECLFRNKEHKLSDAEEELVSKLSNLFSVSSDCFESLTDSDLTFPKIEVNGELLDFNESNYSIFIRSSDRGVRKEAFDNLLGTYSKFKTTLATTFSSNVDTLTSLAKIYKFNNSLEASLFGDNIKTSVYNNLIDGVNSKLDVLYKYYNLKKKLLSVDELHLYDIYANPIKSIDKKYSFSDAKELVIEALSVLGDDYINNLKRAFSERWIDVYNNDHKRGGAYSSGFYDSNPYVLLNFEGGYDDVSTLAHELGHSMHTYYSCKNNSYNNSSYKIFVAEVASTVNELLLTRYLINKSDDKNEKKFLLNQLLELYKGTIYRQVMFSEFERDCHSFNESGGVLTSDYLCDEYYKLVKKYFGDDVVCDDLIKYEWARIPHFYYDFYVYKYAIGLSCATHIVNDILSNKDNSIDNYIKFLSSGGSMYPADELKIVGCDIENSNLYIEAINDFNKYIDEFNDIINGGEKDE